MAILKQLTVNVPLVEALEQMLGYTKFMKDLLTKKRIVSYKLVYNLYHYRAISIRSLVQKKADPGAFTIPYTIGSLDFSNALCDLGVGIYLMTLIVYKGLGSGDPTPINIRLVMADRSVKQQVRILYDVLVKVASFIFPTDFVILDCKIDFEEGIVLGHKISEKGNEVYREKVELIEKLPPPISVKGVHSFLCHDGFYHLFIKDFSKIANPLCKLLEKEAKFVFNEECKKAFECLKEKLVPTPIIVAPDWSKTFEIMCDTSGVALGAVLVQKKEFLAVVYAFEKFHAYLLGNKVVVHTDHTTLRYLMSKKDANLRLIRWMLLLQKFDFKVKDRKGCKSQVADHLSRLEYDQAAEDKFEIDNTFLNEKVLNVMLERVPWYSDFANYVTVYSRGGHVEYPRNYASPVWAHHAGDRTMRKVLQRGYYLPTLFKDAYEFVQRCDHCHRQGSILKHHETLMTKIMEVELFNVWGINFTRLFVSSYRLKYILVSIDYMSKWVEAIALDDNEGKRVVAFLKKTIFSRFRVPRTITSDGGSSFTIECSELLC
ncbi:uncharacterized protein LOC124888861 [Capsicum annuum]|uniref:uncharacterized protein LOC124888861 n=1 Tax=Capsicum annuum TaxID=4072 RepID=UPI001FB064DB|nr:uncharacterized protein LOC124888861 [Capsicum annuum]